MRQIKLWSLHSLVGFTSHAKGSTLNRPLFACVHVRVYNLGEFTSLDEDKHIELV